MNMGWRKLIQKRVLSDIFFSQFAKLGGTESTATLDLVVICLLWTRHIVSTHYVIYACMAKLIESASGETDILPDI